MSLQDGERTTTDLVKNQKMDVISVECIQPIRSPLPDIVSLLLLLLGAQHPPSTHVHQPKHFTCLNAAAATGGGLSAIGLALATRNEPHMAEARGSVFCPSNGERETPQKSAATLQTTHYKK